MTYTQAEHQAWINNPQSGYGGLDNYIKEQQKRYKDAISLNNQDIINRLQADSQRVGYSLLPTTETNKTLAVANTIPAKANSNIQNIYSQLSGNLNQYSFPYEQLMRDMLASQPQYNYRSQEDILSEAQRQAALQIDPQIAALQRAYEQTQQALTTREEQAQAAHAGYETDVAHALGEAAKIAQEQAIARGGGRAGLLDWRTTQLQAPIAGSAERQAAELSSYLQDVANQRALSTQQYGESEQQLAEQRGVIEAQTMEELRRYDDAMVRGDWQMANDIAQGLATLATQSQQFSQQMAANLLPYYEMTERERQYLPIDIAGVAGEWPSGYEMSPVPGSIGLRDYIVQQGGTIEYDPSTKSVIINGRTYDPNDLTMMGGVLKDGRWYLPQSKAAQL